MPQPSPAEPRLTPRKVAALLIPMLIGGVVGVGLAHWGADAMEGLELSALEKLALVAMALLLLPVLVLWHELGHMAGGRLVDFRPLLLVVGPVRWQKADGRWRMSANRSAALAGGLAVCVPEDPHDLAPRAMALIAGGPLASLLGGAAALTAWLALPPLTAASPFAAVAAHTALAVLGFGNLLLAVASLTPTRAGGFYSDGARLLRHWRGGPELDREVAILLLTGASFGGTRPRAWDPELVRRAVGQADGALFHLAGLHLAFAHAHDRGDVDAARELRDAMLAGEETLPPILRPSLRLGVVYFTARHDQDPARVRELLAGADGGLLVDGYIRHLARAAAAWLEGDAERAAAELDRAEAELPRAVDRGAAVAAAGRVAELRALLRERPAPSPALA